MSSELKPYWEPPYVTLVRTVGIALVVGALLARRMGGWPQASVQVLWFSFGGHWVELFFLNWLAPRFPAAAAPRRALRLAVWFAGGALLGLGMGWTARTLRGPVPLPSPAWWLAGAAFVGVELVVHLLLQLGGRPSFYNGRG